MNRVYIGIGSNIGDAQFHVLRAVEMLKESPHCTMLRCASLYGSKPFGPVEQADFVNTVVELDTDLNAEELLEHLKKTEQHLGRTGNVRWGPREIDLDILSYGNLQVNSTELTLPHPGIAERAFVLVPLAELRPDLLLADGQTAEEAKNKLESGLVWPLVEG